MRDQNLRSRAGKCWRAPLCLIVVSVLAAACGSGHQSAATRQTFPNTPAGTQARWLVGALNHLPIPYAAMRTHIGPALLGNSTAAQVNSGLAGIAQVRLVSVSSSQPRSIVFVVSIRGGQREQASLSLDSQGRISVLTTHFLTSTAAPASVTPPLAVGWVAQQVTFAAGGVTVHGTYTHPRAAAARTIPGAVLLAGSGTATDRNDNGTATTSTGKNVKQTNRNTLVAVANWLSADGVATLRYDKLGSGQTGWGSYGGHPERVGLRAYEQEAAAALSFLTRQPQVDPSRLAAVGHSLGGAYALLLGAGLVAHAPPVHAIVLLEPVPDRFLNVFMAGAASAPPGLRHTLARAVASLRRTGRLPGGLPSAVATSFNPADWGTQLEISQIDRYDPARLAEKLPSDTAVLLTCSNADQYFSCAMEDRIAAGIAKAGATADFVHLDGVDHILKEDIARDPAVWNQSLPFSSQLRSALSAFVTAKLH